MFWLWLHYFFSFNKLNQCKYKRRLIRLFITESLQKQTNCIILKDRAIEYDYIFPQSSDVNLKMKDNSSFQKLSLLHLLALKISLSIHSIQMKSFFANLCLSACYRLKFIFKKYGSKSFSKESNFLSKDALVLYHWSCSGLNILIET